MLITVIANLVAVFQAHTGNSSTPGSQHMVLALLVMAALLLRCVVETEQNPWLDHPRLTSHTAHLHVQGKKTEYSGGERAELLVLSRIWEALLRTAEIKRESGRREISSSFKGQKSYRSAKR